MSARPLIVSPRAPLLRGALAVPALGLAAVLAMLGPLPALVGLAISALLLLLLVPSLALPALILLSAFNRYGYAWGDTTIRAEILLTFLLALVVANAVAVRTAPARLLRSPLVAPLALYLIVNLVSTLLFAHERTRGLKLDVQIAAVFLVYVTVLFFLARPGRIRTALDLLWIVTTFEALLGVAAALLYALHVTTFGVQFDPFGLPMVYGTMWEANIFGSFLLGNFFLLLADFVATRRTLPAALALTAIVTGIGLSMTRTVWLGLVLGCMVFGLLFARRRGTARFLVPIIGIALVLALGGLVLGTATPLGGRIADLINLQSSSASGRLVWYQAAVADWSRAPILGLGTGSFNFGAVPGAPHPWLPNLFLLTLHDTGLVGSVVLLSLLWRFFTLCARGMKRPGPEGLWTLGGCISFGALLLAFQSTSGFWFAYPWIVVGITVASANSPPGRTE